MKVTGVITKILDIESGESKAGKKWLKNTFILETSEDYNNVYAFEVFGEEKVNNFTKFNRVGQDVEVDFNVSCNEWKGKYYTSLQAWKIFKAEANEEVVGSPIEEEDVLPF